MIFFLLAGRAAGATAQPGCGLRGRTIADLMPDRVRIRTASGEVEILRSPPTLHWTAPGPAGPGRIDGVVVRFATADGKWLDPEECVSAVRRFSGTLLEMRTTGGGRVRITIDAVAKGHWVVDCVPADETVSSIEVRIPMAQDEHFFGGGDVWGTRSVDLRGHAVRLRNRAGTPDECSYVPFFWSTAGYGVFFDEPREGTLDFGKTIPTILNASFRTKRLRWHLFTGNTPLEILQRYLDLTGYPPAVPSWTLLPQQWRNEGTWDDVWEDVENHEREGVPLGAVWIDRPWALGEYGSDDFTFDPARYPDPAENIRRLHEKGIRVLVWACDFLTADSRLLPFALENRYVNTKPTSRGWYHLDFSNPEAREWWKKQIRKVLDLGIDGIKLDRGQTLPADAQFLSGADPAELHNYHAYLMCRTYWEALREARGDDFQFTPRAGWAGTQAWSMKWPGDLSSSFSDEDGLGAALVAMQTAAMTGFAFWGPDIGGFEGRTIDEDLMIRWIQLGAFSPLMETCGRGDFPRGVWDIGEKAVAAYRYYGQLRAAMLPMLRDAARTAHERGIPMVRPLGFVYPEDPRAPACSDEYFLGPDLLAAPVHAPGTSRTVYLPAGGWADFWQPRRVVYGPTQVTVDLPVERFPIYVREGTGLPMDLGAAPATGLGFPFAREGITFLVFPPGPSERARETPAAADAVEPPLCVAERADDELVVRFAPPRAQEPPVSTVFLRVPMEEEPLSIRAAQDGSSEARPLRRLEDVIPESMEPGTWWWDRRESAAWIRPPFVRGSAILAPR